MLKTSVASFAVLFVATVLPAVAQNNTPSSTPPVAVTASPSPTPTETPAPTEPKEAPKETLDTCKGKAIAQGIPVGMERRAFIMKCEGISNPRAEKRAACRQEALDSGVKEGDDLKAFMKSCMAR